MREKRKNIKGITLVALVVTIIVLLILAGVSVTAVYNGDGILHIASESANKSKIAQIQEELELLKTLIMPGTLDDYMKRLQDESEKYRASEFEQLDEEHWTVVIEERYEFLIYTDDNIGSTRKISSRSSARSNTSGNIIIEFQGEVNTGLLELSEKKGTLKYPETRIFSVIKNTSGGKLSVISSDDSIASASIKGNVVTVTPKITNKNGKRVTITVISEPRGDFLRQKAKYIATVDRGSIIIEATPYEGEYDGKKHLAITDIHVEPEGTKVTYSINEGSYTEEIPEVEMTGEYTVSIRAEKEGFDTIEITKTITIKKQENVGGKENPNLVLSGLEGILTYPTPETFTVTQNTSGGTLSVSSSDESVATASIEGNTITITPQAIEEDGKKVTITVISSETDNYQEQTATYDATVMQGSIIINAKPYKGSYDENNHPAITEITVNPEDATLSYSINGGTYTKDIPNVTNANSYTVSIKAQRAGYLTAEETMTTIINKQENQGSTSTTNPNLVLSPTSGTITYPTPGTFTVTKNTSEGTLSVTSSNENVVTASISGNTVTLTPKAVTSTETITVKSAATDNYEEQTATYTVNVIGNRAPVFAQNSTISKSWNSSTYTTNFTVTAKATDEDTSDKLTYTVYMKPSSSADSEYKAVGTSSATTQGQTATINVTQYNGSSLANYTDYSWKVAVTDGKVPSAVQEGRVTTTKTYCRTYSCTSGRTSTVTCSACSGNGSTRPSSCPGQYKLTGWRSYSQYYKMTCEDCRKSIASYETYYYPYYVCNKCGNEIAESPGILAWCSSCKSTHTSSLFSKDHAAAKDITCSSCSGRGTKTSYTYCGHGYASSHWYCGHSNSTSSNYHS